MYSTQKPAPKRQKVAKKYTGLLVMDGDVQLYPPLSKPDTKPKRVQKKVIDTKGNIFAQFFNH